MLPESQSSDSSARQGPTYRSKPSAKQVRFPIRRSKVRDQSKGKGVQKRKDASLKQQTLTQMDFVSSFSSFSEEVTLTDSDDDDDAPSRTAVPNTNPEAEAPVEKRPHEEATRGNSPVIQDSFASPDDNFLDDVLGIVSPIRLRPSQVSDITSSPRRVRIMSPLGNVNKSSPRRQAYWNRNSEGSKRLKPSSQEDDMSSPTRIHPLTEPVDDREIPDSDEEYEELELQQDEGPIHQETFMAGHETQVALEELASLEYPGLDEEEQGQDTTAHQSLSLTPHSSTLNSSTNTAKSRSILPVKAAERLPSPPTIIASSQSPTISPSPDASQIDFSQRRHDPVFESQRVPLHILQSFTPVSARTDILLPTTSKVLGSLVDGSKAVLNLPYQIPEQVGRFWLLDRETLRYMACVQPGKPSGASWGYHIDQVYELNNPVEERDMQEEGWVTGQIRRYIYLPPAIVGQLLWNLRCAIFDRAGHKLDGENSQENSSVECTPSQPVIHSENYKAQHDTGQPSSLLFQDHGSSLATLSTNPVFDSSPLLTKSQMLSDSLLRDDAL